MCNLSASNVKVEALVVSAMEIGLLSTLVGDQNVDSFFETANGGLRVKMIMAGFVPAKLRTQQ